MFICGSLEGPGKGRAWWLSLVAPPGVMWVLGQGWAPLGGWGLPALTQDRYMDFIWGWESRGYSLVSSSFPSSCIFVQENPSYKGDASDSKASGVVRTKQGSRAGGSDRAWLLGWAGEAMEPWEGGWREQASQVGSQWFQGA